MMTAWTSFARTGEPCLPDSRWPPIGAEDQCVVLSEQIEIRPFPRAAALDFLDQVIGPQHAQRRGAAIRANSTMR
jgi:hypothetical protein